jgi:hypothetical protein
MKWFEKIAAGPDEPHPFREQSLKEIERRRERKKKLREERERKRELQRQESEQPQPEQPPEQPKPFGNPQGPIIDPAETHREEPWAVMMGPGETTIPSEHSAYFKTEDEAMAVVNFLRGAGLDPDVYNVLASEEEHYAFMERHGLDRPPGETA